MMRSVLCKALVFALTAAKASSSSTPEARIVGGDSVTAGRMPYFVSLVDAAGVHQCGGTLIASNLVLTSAACAKG